MCALTNPIVWNSHGHSQVPVLCSSLFSLSLSLLLLSSPLFSSLSSPADSSSSSLYLLFCTLAHHLFSSIIKLPYGFTHSSRPWSRPLRRVQDSGADSEYTSLKPWVPTPFVPWLWLAPREPSLGYPGVVIEWSRFWYNLDCSRRFFREVVFLQPMSVLACYFASS